MVDEPMVSKDRHIVGPWPTERCSHGRTSRYLKVGVMMKKQNLLWLACNSHIRAVQRVRWR